MLYCSTVWSNSSTQNINKLQSIQNFARKIVTCSRKFDHVTPLLRQLNWLPVKQLLYYMDSVFTYKCFKDLAPKIWYTNLLNAPASMLATPANVIYYIYSRLPITRTFKGNRKKFELSGVRVIGSTVDGFHSDVIKLQSQNSEVLRILIFTGLKVNKK